MRTDSLYYIGDQTWEDDPGHQFHAPLSDFLARRDALIHARSKTPLTEAQIEDLEALLIEQRENEVYIDTLKAFIRIDGYWAKEFDFFIDGNGENYLFNTDVLKAKDIINYVYDCSSRMSSREHPYHGGYTLGIITDNKEEKVYLLHFFVCHVDELNFLTSEHRIFIKDYVRICYVQDLSEILYDSTVMESVDEELEKMLKYVTCVIHEDRIAADKLRLDNRLCDAFQEAGEYYLSLLKEMRPEHFDNQINLAFLLSTINTSDRYMQ